jgi:DNA-binding PadR family transcriptional regulator
MLLSTQSPKSLEELIIETLHKEAAEGPALLLKLKKKDVSISKETFYRVLRSLLKDEVVSKHAKTYEINRHWLQRIYRFGKKHIESPAVMDSDSILSFKEGDKITYSFKNPNLMGIYWAHTYDMIFEHRYVTNMFVRKRRIDQQQV